MSNLNDQLLDETEYSKPVEPLHVICRKLQQDTLLELMGKHPLQLQSLQPSNSPDMFPLCPSSIYIYGMPCTGKSTTLKHILCNDTSTRSVWINCLEAYTLRLLFESILDALAGVDSSAANGYRAYARCDTLDEFVEHIREICGSSSAQMETSSTLFLVFEKADSLRDLGCPTLISYLLNLSEWSGVRLCVIFISNMVWDDFCSDSLANTSITVYFPPYTKDEAMDIVALDCPKTEAPDFYLTFANTLYDVFSSSCRHLTELRHITSLLFPKYIEPVLQGKATRQQVSKLFGLAQTHIKEALHSLYLRDISSCEWQRRSTKSNGLVSTNVDLAKSYDMPYYTKFLVIASYLASFNPPRLDSRFFTKAKESKGKRVGKKGSVHNGSKMRQQLLGPKAFNVERMLAIFYSILGEDVDVGFNAHTQISTLASLRLLVRVTTMDKIDAAKYKCTASYEFVSSIGRSVRFDLSQYLFDFINV
ncbi:hypothetical protein QVD99_006763 [Batrachochytrium dendrobatidis]|nr:hypothetical protein O5D80_005256 [Batrachochytrium dendrobatidis]KAK5666702.1 hypothetical protein QVD99_006763 [Batrachochytrium dendrobatidis]